MGVRPSRRAVSTAVDVSFALVLLSASVVLMAAFLEDGGPAPPEPAEADRTAETLASVTVDVEYSLQSVAANDRTGTFDGTNFGDAAYRRVDHGTAAGLLAEAAMANLRVGDERLTPAGAAYEQAVATRTLNAMVGANDDVHVVALWRPYEGARIEGRAVAGRRPPADAAVSTTTLTVASDVPSVEPGAVASAYRSAEDDRYEAAAEPIAAAIVAGYFPSRETQHALESQAVDGYLIRYRYRRLASVLGFEYPAADGLVGLTGQNVVNRTSANARQANERLVEALTAVIAADLRAQYGGDPDPETLARSVSTGEVTITVRTW